ncbi:MAG TPA: heavy metal sensor histidine kinase [Planctomycetota bacterium]
MRSASAALTSVSVAVSGLTLAALAVSLDLWTRESQERALEREARTRLRLFQERWGKDDLRREMEDFLAASGDLGEVRGAGGEVLFRSAAFDASAAERRTVAERAGGLEFLLSASRLPYDRTIAQMRTYFAVFLPLTLLVAGALGYLAVRRTLAPLETIRRQAERISRANVSERVPEGALAGEFRALARTCNEMLDRLDGAIQDLQSFAADAAHELRTPLATLRTEIEMSFQTSRSAEDFAATLTSVAEEVSRMNRIVNDLFTLAKLDMRRYALQKERVRLLPILEDTRETWQPVADERGIEIRREGGDAQVAADPVALRRVFMNLVQNAVKYNKDRGQVVMSVEPIDGKVRVHVRDTGIGIPPEHLPRLFRRFYRLDQARSRDTGGAGLGLAICKSFVEAHGGTIEVASVPDQGTRFTVEIPALADA